MTPKNIYKRLITFVFLSLTAVTVTSAQETSKIDSLTELLSTQSDTTLLNTYEELYFLTIRKEPTNAKPYLDKALELVKEIKSPKHKADWKKNHGTYYYYVAEYQNASKIYKEATELYKELGDKDGESAVYNNLGIVLKYTGQLEKALEAHLNSLELKKELGLGGYPLAASYLNIGVLHSELNNLEASNDYYEQAEAIFLDQGDDYRLSIVRSNLALNMEMEGKNKEALDYYLQSLPYFIDNGYKVEEAKQYNFIGAAYFKMDSLYKSKSYFQKAQDLGNEIGEIQIEELATRNLGDVAYEQKRYSEALSAFRKALDLSQESGTETRRVTTYLRLSKTYAALGNYKKAYEYRKTHFDEYDKVYKKENIEKINDLEVKYQTEQKEQQIVLQDKEIALLEKEAKMNRLQQLLMLVCLLLAALGIYTLVQRVKHNRLKKEQAETKVREQAKDLDRKNRELTNYAFAAARKNETLDSLKKEVENIKKSSAPSGDYRRLLNIINADAIRDDGWTLFSKYFNDVHKGFNTAVRSQYPDITRNEMRLISLIKMNLSTKEIASTLNISVAGVKKARQRLRKKMALSPGDSLDRVITEMESS